MMVRNTRKRAAEAPIPASPSWRSGGGDSSAADYESCRDERIKENLERMKSLGILDLSLKLKSSCTRPARARATSSPAAGRKFSDQPPLLPRRSSRLQNVAPVSYVESHASKDENPVKKRLIFIEEGAREEVYTEEHEKLLGSCEATWTLFVDGYDSNGKRIYDQIKGKTCHQCRQKTLGYHTHCSKCNLVQGQFCGDCLYMRYGENVLEANKNPNWVCPVCRGFCNCSLCRNKKGWAPTGALYKKVLSLGFNSVAHYLIQTRRSNSNSEDPSTDDAKFTKPIESLEQEDILRSHPDDNESNKESKLLSTDDHTVAVDNTAVENSTSEISDKAINERSEATEHAVDSTVEVKSGSHLGDNEHKESKSLSLEDHIAAVDSISAKQTAPEISEKVITKRLVEIKHAASVEEKPGCHPGDNERIKKSKSPSLEDDIVAVGRTAVEETASEISGNIINERPEAFEHAASVEAKPDQIALTRNRKLTTSPDCIASRLRSRQKML